MERSSTTPCPVENTATKQAQTGSRQCDQSGLPLQKREKRVFTTPFPQQTRQKNTHACLRGKSFSKTTILFRIWRNNVWFPSLSPDTASSGQGESCFFSRRLRLTTHCSPAPTPGLGKTPGAPPPPPTSRLGTHVLRARPPALPPPPSAGGILTAGPAPHPNPSRPLSPSEENPSGPVPAHSPRPLPGGGLLMVRAVQGDAQATQRAGPQGPPAPPHPLLSAAGLHHFKPVVTRHRAPRSSGSRALCAPSALLRGSHLCGLVLAAPPSQAPSLLTLTFRGRVCPQPPRAGTVLSHASRHWTWLSAAAAERPPPSPTPRWPWITVSPDTFHPSA